MGTYRIPHTGCLPPETKIGSYDAGVLGGVQDTRPFQEALGVST